MSTLHRRLSPALVISLFSAWGAAGCSPQSSSLNTEVPPAADAGASPDTAPVAEAGTPPEAGAAPDAVRPKADAQPPLDTAGEPLTLPWPGGNQVAIVDNLNQFGGNMSGLSYQPAASGPGTPDVLWAVQNGPSMLYRLVANGNLWTSTTTGGWSAGKTLRYPDGTGGPDAEGVTKAEMDSPAIYVSTERDNNNGGVSRLSVLRFDTSAPGTTLVATHEWKLNADLPAVGANTGLEAIAWIPDTFLVSQGFIDESTGHAYDPSRYPSHGTGIFFVGLEANAQIYAYALDHASGGYHRLATMSSGQTIVADLAFDRDNGYLWTLCDWGCNDRASVLRIEGAGKFKLARYFERPSSLPDSNNEGITFAPDAECVNGRKAFFWADDGNINGHSIRRDTIPCGRFF